MLKPGRYTCSRPPSRSRTTAEQIPHDVPPRQALANEDYERAANLTAKARRLTDDLTRLTR
jgi:hypothetical protein